MLTLCYSNTKHADAAKVEFNDILPDYSVENVPATKTAGEFDYTFVLQQLEAEFEFDIFFHFGRKVCYVTHKYSFLIVFDYLYGKLGKY